MVVLNQMSAQIKHLGFAMTTIWTVTYSMMELEVGLSSNWNIYKGESCRERDS